MIGRGQPGLKDSTLAQLSVLPLAVVQTVRMD